MIITTSTEHFQIFNFPINLNMHTFLGLTAKPKFLHFKQKNYFLHFRSGVGIL